jgi:hypothetical protein
MCSFRGLRNFDEQTNLFESFDEKSRRTPLGTQSVLHSNPTLLDRHLPMLALSLLGDLHLPEAAFQRYLGASYAGPYNAHVQGL